ncbi:MAG: ATPase, partial [Bacteroidota bacterium]
CTFNTNLSKIDSALLRKGRMIAKYEFKALSKEKTDQLLKALGHDSGPEALTIASIYNHSKLEFQNDKPAKIGF